MRAGDVSGAREPLERAAKLAPEASGDDSPRALLAAMDEKTDPARARRWLRELLTYDHTNVAAARRLAALAQAAKATDDEDFALRLISALDPFDGATHARLGGRLLAKGETSRPRCSSSRRRSRSGRPILPRRTLTSPRRC